MEEEDYIKLNTLLAKLRVECLKNLDNNVIRKKREKNLKIIRSIDYIRKNVYLTQYYTKNTIFFKGEQISERKNYRKNKKSIGTCK